MNENLATPDREIEQAISDIRETESRLAHIISEIQSKLTPDSIEKRAWAEVRKRLFGGIEEMTDRGLKEMNENIGSGAVDTIRNHPVSTAMFGLGLGLLMVEGWRRRSGKENTAEQPATEEYQSEGLMPENQEETAGLPYMESYEARDRRDYPSGRVSKLKNAAVQRTHNAREKVSHAVDERPLLVGIIGLTAGMIIGAMTSGALRDNRFLQEKRQDLKQKTRELLQDRKERAEHVLADAKRAIKEAAEREHLITH